MKFEDKYKFFIEILSTIHIIPYNPYSSMTKYLQLRQDNQLVEPHSREHHNQAEVRHSLAAVHHSLGHHNPTKYKSAGETKQLQCVNKIVGKSISHSECTRTMP